MRSWLRTLGPPLAIALAALVAYANTFRVPFLFDDASIRDTSSLHTLSWQTVVGTTRPLVQLSLALNWAAHGADVVGYHAVNFVVHLLAALALYGLAVSTLRATTASLGAPGARLAGPEPLALAIALVWAVHPLQTESVTYVVQRAESMMGLCYLLTLLCVVRGAGSPHHASAWYTGALVACVLGMLCKPVMASAPIVVLLYDRAFLAGSFTRAWRERRSLHLALVATWVVLVAVLGQAHESAATAGFAMRDVSFAEFARSQPGVILRYLQLAVLPVGLVLDYGWPPAEGFAGIVLPTLLLGGGLAALLMAFRAEPRLQFLVLAFVLILVPSSSVVPIRDLAFEHRMYLPLAPLVALLAVGAAATIGRVGLVPATARTVALVGTTALVATLAALTLARNHDYRTPLAMWSDVTAKRPANPRGLGNLAHVLAEEGRFEEASAAAETALRLAPNYPEAHVPIGVALAKRGRYDEAVAHYATALRLRPDYPEAHYNWGTALADQQRFAAAEPHYLEALRQRPSYFQAQNNLAIAVMHRGDYAAAERLFRQALAYAPDYPEPYSNLGNLLLRQGKRAEAVEQYRRALALRPTSAEIHFNLASTLADEGRRDEASAHAAEAARLRPDLAPRLRQAGLVR